MIQMWSGRAAWKRTLGLALMIYGLVSALGAIPVLREFRYRVGDTYFRTTPAPAQPSRVALVMIDDESLREYGRWPWSRVRLAELVRKLTEADARVIGLDILLSEPQSQLADSELAAALAESKRTVLVDKIGSYSDGPHWIEPLPIFANAAAGVGHVQAVLDTDGICRRFPPRELSLDGTRWSFALSTARFVDPERTAAFLARYGISADDSGQAVLVAKPDLIPIAYRKDSFTTISAAAVLQGRDLRKLQRRLVLVGFGPTEISDRLSTPLTNRLPASGVEVHAQVLDSILTGRIQREMPVGLEQLLVFLACLGIVSLFGSLRGWSTVLWLVICSAIVYLAGWLTFVLALTEAPAGSMLLAVVFGPLVVYASDFVLVERTVNRQMQSLREWLLLRGRRKLHEEPGDFSWKLALLQELQTELGSLFELHESLLAATSDAIGIFDNTGFLLLQNGNFAGLFHSYQQLTKLDEVQATIAWSGEEFPVAGGMEREGYVGDELFSVRTVPLPPTRLSPRGGTILILTSLKAREERDRSRAEALGFITHELRTPLTSILGFSELMMAYPGSPQCEGAPETIYRESKRLLALVHSYLDVLRLDAGARPLNAEPARVDEIVRQVFETLQPLAAAMDMTLEFSGDDSLVIRADAALLNGAILNLVSNAIKYGRQASVITVRCARGEDAITLAVHNFGEVIDSRDLPALFSAYYRGHRSRREIRGWGLGLAFVKRIAEKHGGTADVDSSEEGTTFTIRLPASVAVAVLEGV